MDNSGGGAHGDQGAAPAPTALPTASVPLPMAQKVASNFASQYYRMLSNNPEELYRFYKSNSIFVFSQSSACLNGESSPGREVSAVGQDQIKKEILLTLRPFAGQPTKAILTGVEGQDTRREGFMILVTGHLAISGDLLVQPFTQAFCLEKQVEPYPGYYVLSDILRYFLPTLNPAQPQPPLTTIGYAPTHLPPMGMSSGPVPPPGAAPSAAPSAVHGTLPGPVLGGIPSGMCGAVPGAGQDAIPPVCATVGPGGSALLASPLHPSFDAAQTVGQLGGFSEGAPMMSLSPPTALPGSSATTGAPASLNVGTRFGGASDVAAPVIDATQMLGEGRPTDCDGERAEIDDQESQDLEDIDDEHVAEVSLDIEDEEEEAGDAMHDELRRLDEVEATTCGRDASVGSSSYGANNNANGDNGRSEAMPGAGEQPERPTEVDELPAHSVEEQEEEKPRTWASITASLKQGGGQLGPSKVVGFAAKPESSATVSAALGTASATGSASGIQSKSNQFWLWISRLPTDPAAETQEIIDGLNGFLVDWGCEGRTIEVDRRDSHQDWASVMISSQDAADTLVTLSKDRQLFLRGKAVKAEHHRTQFGSRRQGNQYSGGRGRGGKGNDIRGEGDADRWWSAAPRHANKR